MLTIESLYSSLYKKPLYELIHSKGKKKSLDIFILGDNVDALLCFKTVFCCGQLSFPRYEYNFNITVVCENSNEVKDEYISVMPALFEYNLANICFIEKTNSYSETLVKICKNKACVFNCTSESLDLSLNTNLSFRIYEINDNVSSSNGNVEAVVIGATKETELNELAFGVHFNYMRSFDPYADKRVERNSFFLDDNEYNRNSSLAAALHIRYKLYSVGVNWFDSDNADEMAATLDGISKIINQKGKPYDELVRLEHNRWMAYMISSGFTAPTDDELEGYAFNYYEYDGKKGFIKSFKNAAYPPYKHPCIVPCISGVVLSRLRKKEWDNLSESDIKKLDELDKVSVKLHRLAEKKSAEYYSKIFAILDNLSEVTIIFDEVANLKIIVEMLYNQNLRAEALLDKNIRIIKAKIADDNDEIIEKINALSNLLEVVKERNRYHDYKSSDSDLIDMLPYIIYSVKPYHCFIKFYSPDIVSNVTSISTILPDKIVFWGIDSDDVNFMNNTKDFLLNRHIIDENSHQNKELVFYKYQARNVENICRKFYDFLEKYNIEADDCIIDITDASPNLCTAAGVISSSNNIPVIRFDVNKGIQPVMNEGKLCFSTNIPKASIDELYSLLNCKELFRISHDDALSLKEVMIKLYGIFEEYKDVWTNSITAIQKLKPDVIIFQRTNAYIKANKNNPIKHFCDSVSAVSFNGKRLDKFLGNAEKLGIIDSLHIKANNENYDVEFDYYDQVIIDKVINNSENYPITIRFSGTDLKFIQHSLKVRNTLIPDDFPSDSLKILEKAKKLQLIKNFKIEERYISLEFINSIVKKCFTIDGAALELLVFNAAYDSSYFDDVKNNFHFLWDRNTSSSIVTPENRKFTGISEFKPVLSNTALECVKNEIDVIVAKNFKLKVISCKSGKIKQLDLMQVKNLAEFFRKHGKATLAYSNDGINKETQIRTLDPVLKRAAEMQIDCICPSDIFGKKNELIEKLKKGI